MERIELTDARKKDYYYVEAMKTLRTNVLFSGKEVKAILLTSCFPNEGKSDAAMDLAKNLGEVGKRVLLIDADIRKSSLLRRYSINEETKGLSEYLSGLAELKQVMYKTNFENMDIIFSGTSAPNPAELLETNAFQVLLTELKKFYNYIILDCPPLGTVIDAAIVAKQCDGAIFVVEADKVSYRKAQKVQEQLKKTGCRILGAVLNKVDIKKDKYYHKYSYYYSDSQKRKA